MDFQLCLSTLLSDVDLFKLDVLFDQNCLRFTGVLALFALCVEHDFAVINIVKDELFDDLFVVAGYTMVKVPALSLQKVDEWPL